MVGKGKGKEKGKGSCWVGMNPIVSVVTEVATMAGETTKETGLMDCQ